MPFHVSYAGGVGSLEVREAVAADAAGCVAVYAPYVAETAITFETEVPSAAEMRARIERAVAEFAWLVLVDGDHVAGFGFGHAVSDKGAYRRSCETSIYLAAEARGQGAGRRLYEALLARLQQRGIVRVLAGFTEPNEPSARLHRALGFEDAGRFSQIGWKLGRWHDVHWMQKTLSAPGDAGAPVACAAN
jgi:L-amino acid N-acyltransferase YncA